MANFCRCRSLELCVAGNKERQSKRDPTDCHCSLFMPDPCSMTPCHPNTTAQAKKSRLDVENPTCHGGSSDRNGEEFDARVARARLLEGRAEKSKLNYRPALSLVSNQKPDFRNFTLHSNIYQGLSKTEGMP